MTTLLRDTDNGRENSDQPPVVLISAASARELFDTHGSELLAFLIGVLRDKSAADDVLQTSFRRLLESGHTAQKETIKGWLFKVALREALVYRRQAARNDKFIREYSISDVNSQEIYEPADVLAKAEDVERIRQLLSQLPPDQQQVIQQRIYEHKTFATIAEDSRVPIGTVLTRMRLALEKLRNWFGSP